MKTWKVILVILTMVLVGFVGKMTAVNADTTVEGVCVTVPANIQVVFEEDGSATVSGLYLENDSLVPIMMDCVNITEFNQWKLVSPEQEILADSKQVSVSIDHKELVAGRNAVYYEIAENSRCDFQMQVGHGAWTKQMAPEKALEMEFAYQIGTKEFALYLKGNGGMEDTTIYAENGSEVSLPKPVREDYEFAGWKDENGMMHRDTYLMPIGSATLQAVWKKQKAYAIFTAEDSTLTFVKTAEEILEGQTYDGKTVSNVFTGFEEDVYTSGEEVPWHQNQLYKEIRKLVIKDRIKPISTAFWFYESIHCLYYEVGNLDTSQVKDMQYMYWKAGYDVGPEKSLVIRGMETWNTSNVTNMACMFTYSGTFIGGYDIGDIGKWDVSNVTTMSEFFFGAAMRATTINIGDLSYWNTENLSIVNGLFSDFGMFSPYVWVGDLGKWKTSKFITMTTMFSNMGMKATTFYIGDISGWDVSNVQRMGSCFESAGETARWTLDCSKWNVQNVTEYGHFNYCSENRIIAPKWVH